ncbi:tRNA dimethylallyltransferase [Planctomycetaceae bacterium SCGC AG-212-F19]|nr:tRNA dimethylallyltransferase [Planctomycetaceae bacterium SCGC AG-212-F19]
MTTAIYVLTGPTGCGKTELGIALAERLGAEIIAMDSMTLYRGMDIGTAKPDAEQRRRVPHHLIDILDPWESASVAFWLERSLAFCKDIHARGKRALFVGGTPLYLKALLHGLFDGPPASAELRQRLATEADTLGPQALHDRLAQVDAVTAARLHANDQRRIIRALEVWELTGRPISAWQTQWGNQRTEDTGDTTEEGQQISVLCLDRPRAELYARINARVERMIAAGLVDEVRALRQTQQPISREAAQALGYKEVFAHLDGQATLEETVRRIQTRTRNFAKRQMTWFRHLPECRPVTEELAFQLWAT